MEYNKKYYQKNKEKWIKVYNYTENAKERRRKYNYTENAKKSKRKYVLANKSKIKHYRKENREKAIDYSKEYYKQNKKKMINQNRLRANEKYKTDKDFNLKVRLRARLRLALKHYTETGKIMSSRKYGVNYKEIIKYLKPFPKDLSNYEIHHIKPLYTFKFILKDGSTDLKEVSKAFSPKNHKWLTIEEHRKINHKSY